MNSDHAGTRHQSASGQEAVQGFHLDAFSVEAEHRRQISGQICIDLGLNVQVLESDFRTRCPHAHPAHDQVMTHSQEAMHNLNSAKLPQRSATVK